MNFVSKKINDLNGPVNKVQKSWCLSDNFHDAKGNTNLLKC